MLNERRNYSPEASEYVREYYRKQGEKRERERIADILEEYCQCDVDYFCDWHTLSRDLREGLQ